MKDVTETFNTVYDATFRELMRCCLLKVPIEDAHDLLQNTYAQFYRTLLKKGSSAIRDPKAYLMTVLKHEIASYYRSGAKRKTVSLEVLLNRRRALSLSSRILPQAALLWKAKV